MLIREAVCIWMKCQKEDKHCFEALHDVINLWRTEIYNEQIIHCISNQILIITYIMLVITYFFP